MQASRSLPKPILAVLAAILAGATILYSGLWIYCAGVAIPVELGFDNLYSPTRNCEQVKSTVPGSPADRAGMQAGDCIVLINGAPLKNEVSLPLVWAKSKPGDTVELSVQRPGVSSPVILHGIFRASSEGTVEAGMAQHLGRKINQLYPVAFLAVGFIVLFLRLDDRNAWLLALLFCGFIAIPGFSNLFFAVPLSLRPFAMIYRAIFNNTLPALFYLFFTLFPTRSPLDRRLPWLKWLAIAVDGSLALLTVLDVIRLGAAAFENHGLVHLLVLIFSYSLILLGFSALIANAVSAPSSDDRRKTRVILWGTLVGVVPATIALAAVDFLSYHMTLWVGAIIILLLWLFPLSFAYAVVKHRVLEIPVLLRRSARYLLVQRGFVFLLVVLGIGVTLAFALYFARYLQPLTGAAVPGGIALGAVFGTLLVWSGTRVHQDVERRIDRAFFRSAYDARTILEDLVEKTRTATNREELAVLLERHLKNALQPNSLLVYLETCDDQLQVVTGNAPPEARTISPGHPALVSIAEHHQPWEVSDDGAAPPQLAAVHPDCIVPILGRDSRLVGMIVLGRRLSEEPYSREDKQLLAAAANQAGAALETIRLAEKVAERIEAERRMAREMEFAQQVQARLFPQKLPPMKTLDYNGGCIPARTVGGDYYDFLELRPGRLGLVLADIAGKGIPGALLMANLQANLRSQYAMAIDDLPLLLSSVNKLFYQSTDQASYATLFFADYDDSTQVLRYANCGHLPPLLLRAGKAGQTHTIESLAATTTVLGLFEDWKCEIAETRLSPGDTVLLYTDGITEATNANDEEFGEARLRPALCSRARLPVSELLEGIVSEVKLFSAGEQQDDITLLVARCVG